MKHSTPSAQRALPNVALTAAAFAVMAIATPAFAAGSLSGWATMPANTFAPGPTSGQFQSPANGVTPPYIDKQPVQGFSAVLNGPTAGSFYVMPDNGFGNKANSADALLRVYAINPDFKTRAGGSGTVSAVDYQTGVKRSSFDNSTFINLRDPDGKIAFPTVASQANYPNAGGNVPVDAAIKSGRLLTGADFDIESMRKDKNGNLWFGEEFGPFLVKTDATGKVLRSEVGLPGVQSPSNPNLGGNTPTLNDSNGFEGMAINPAGDKLYTLLEGTVKGDAAKSLRINEFSIDSEAYTGKSFLYGLDARGTNIGDMTAINDHEFLVIERDGSSGDPSGFKKIFKIDIDSIDANGYAQKTEVVDLMHIADPFDLNGDGSNAFNFPFVTIEDVLILDANTLMVINDNNFPGGGGRGNGFPDATEFLKITLDQPLAITAAVPEPETYALMLGGLGAVAWVARRRRAD
ncbi:MAG: hypothetical protein JWP52_957 [Rhizobacter sp.]|nr:hypothetical protein [Rhizobacter sp.]